MRFVNFVAIAALAMAISLGSARADVLIPYLWSDDASVSDGVNTEHLSGGFVWNATTGHAFSIDTVVTGLITGSFTVLRGTGSKVIDATNTDASLFLQVFFENSLSDGQIDPIALGGTFVSTLVNNLETTPRISPTQVSGSAIPATASVPEPMSLSVLCVGLVALGIGRGRMRSKPARAVEA